MSDLEEIKKKLLLERDVCAVDEDRRFVVHKHYSFGACFACDLVFTVS